MQKTSYIFSILYLFLLYVPTYIIAEPHKMHGKHRRVRGENKGVVVPSLSYRYNDIDRQESHKMLRNMYEQRMNEEMEKIEKIRAAIDKNKDHIKTLRKHEDKRRAKVTHHEKHQALITARHAETKKESEEKEYACSRIHGTVDHPGIKALQKKDRDLHNDLSAAHKEYKKYKKELENYLQQTGSDDEIQKKQQKQQDHALEQKIVTGEHHRWTRKRLNESKSDIRKKKKIEAKRKEREAQTKVVKKRFFLF